MSLLKVMASVKIKDDMMQLMTMIDDDDSVYVGVDDCDG